MITDSNYSLSDEQSERRWKKNVGVDGKERQRRDEKKWTVKRGAVPIEAPRNVRVAV